jgi:hypothetical protein
MHLREAETCRIVKKLQAPRLLLLVCEYLHFMQILERVWKGIHYTFLSSSSIGGFRRKSQTDGQNKM